MGRDPHVADRFLGILSIREVGRHRVLAHAAARLGSLGLRDERGCGPIRRWLLGVCSGVAR